MKTTFELHLDDWWWA